MTAATVNDAAPIGANDKSPPLIAKAEALLDRAHFTPGEIDGLDGDNFHSAVRAFQESSILAVTGNLDAGTWNALASNDTAPVLKAYTISDADVSGPFTKVIPINLEEMAKLPGLLYTGPLAELAEKFHMAQSLLRRLNPLADFERAGTEILVADVPEMNLRAGRDTVEVVQPRNIRLQSPSPSWWTSPHTTSVRTTERVGYSGTIQRQWAARKSRRQPASSK
jgi:hypothetical protein